MAVNSKHADQLYGNEKSAEASGTQNGKPVSCGILRSAFSVVLTLGMFLNRLLAQRIRERCILPLSPSPLQLGPRWVSLSVRMGLAGITQLGGSPLAPGSTWAVAAAPGSVSQWQPTQFGRMITRRKKCPVANEFHLVRLRPSSALPLLSLFSITWRCLL